MNLDLEPMTKGNFIQSYTPGSIKVQNESYSYNLLITQTKIKPWLNKALEDLSLGDLELLLELEPEIILIGCGEQLKFLPPKLMHSVQQHGIGIEIMTTDAACRTFNVLLNEGRKVLGALILSS